MAGEEQDREETFARPKLGINSNIYSLYQVSTNLYTYLHIYVSTYLHIYISTYLHIYVSTYIYCVQTKQLQQPPSSYVSQVPGPGPPSAPAKAAPAPATESPPEDYLDQEPAAPPEVIRRHRTRCVLNNYRDLLED